MRALEAFARLRGSCVSVVTTSEAAAALSLSDAGASRALRGLADHGAAVHLRHGLWSLDPHPDPLVVMPFLTTPFPAYVSGDSALARRGLFDQIPREMYVVSTARTERIDTALGTFHVHHIQPELFDGFDEAGVAVPEKAVFDLVYMLAARRLPRLARAIPEIELPDGFDERLLHAWTARISAPQVSTLVRGALRETLERLHAEMAFG